MNILAVTLLFVAALGPLPEIAVTQDITPTATITATATLTPTDWSFPVEPLVPYAYDDDALAGVIEMPLTPARLWDMARVALTSYTVISRGDGNTWLLFVAVLLIPTAGLVIYKWLTNPPEI
jgi:hypothetical protein